MKKYALKEYFEKDMARWARATKVRVNELIESDYDNMLYLDNDDRYFTDIGELLEFLSDQYSDGVIEAEDVSSKRIYKTNRSSISFDAQHIIGNATEDHHECAYEAVMKYEKELQDFLDKFADKVKNLATSYYPDYKNGVLVTLDDISERGAKVLRRNRIGQLLSGQTEAAI